jgi:hypothetical protein
MKYLVLAILLAFSSSAFAQKEINPDFLDHLMKKDFHKEVVFLIDQTDISRFDQPLKDSLHFMRGWSLYAQKKLSRSAENLKKVSMQSNFYLKSHFFAAYNYFYLRKNNTAQHLLDSIKTDKININSIKHLEKAGGALLNRNFEKFREEFSQVDTSYYPITDESAKINQYATELVNHNTKSPLLAGIMSSVIPGSGKIYAGKTGEGISSFLTVGGLGLVTWENYRKKGAAHFKTILFGSLFSAFYIGNIYGTVFSVKLAEDEFQKMYDNKILFNIHVPLRNVFN